MGEAGAQAEASTTTVRTVITGPAAPAAAADPLALERFDGVELDPIAREELAAILADCARRRRAAAGTADDPAEIFFAAEQPLKEMLVYDEGYTHPRKELRRPPPASDNVVAEDAFLESSPRQLAQPDEQYRSGPEEMSWTMLDQQEEMARIEAAVRQIAESKAKKRSAEGKANDGAADASP